MTEQPNPYEQAREVALWERGEELARVCQGWLDGARKRLDAAIESEED
jgi:exodeoxyribonuclease VII small subunit